MVDDNKVFDAPLSRREAARKLLQLRQESRNVADYAVDFHTLAVESAWNMEALFDKFQHCQDRWVTQDQRRERRFNCARSSKDSTFSLRHPGSPRQPRC